jgi:hypothetical protein
MVISIINQTNGAIHDAEVQEVIRAVNRQIREDFVPYWGTPATLRLEGRTTGKHGDGATADLRGDAVIYLWNESDKDDAIGYHLQNYIGIPYGFVFSSLTGFPDEPWSVRLSHEALELIGDPETNRLVAGPHPSEARHVFHWFEICDAVQSERYQIDGISVSNFLLPVYFTGTRRTDEAGLRSDFLGSRFDGYSLTSFGVNPGGCIGFFDPILQRHEMFCIKDDSIARRRMQLDNVLDLTRRSARYQSIERRRIVEREIMKRMPVAIARRSRNVLSRIEYESLQDDTTN